mgnify:CR=1 FL=1
MTHLAFLRLPLSEVPPPRRAHSGRMDMLGLLSDDLLDHQAAKACRALGTVVLVGRSPSKERQR